MIIAASTLAIADEAIPPLPRVGSPNGATAQPVELPEQQSPCTFDLDVHWLKPLTIFWADPVRYKIPKLVNCEGAVIQSVFAKGSNSGIWFQFKIAYRPGHDREGIVSFGLLDGETLVALGEASYNLDEGEDSYLEGTWNLSKNELENVFAEGHKPVLRITLRLEDN